jgi:hypothetical protein
MNNLVDKQPCKPSAELGMHSIFRPIDATQQPFEDSSPGAKSIPSL